MGVHPWRQRDASGLQGAGKPLRPAPSPQRTPHFHRVGSPSSAHRCGRKAVFFSGLSNRFNRDTQQSEVQRVLSEQSQRPLREPFWGIATGQGYQTRLALNQVSARETVELWGLRSKVDSLPRTAKRRTL